MNRCSKKKISNQIDSEVYIGYTDWKNRITSYNVCYTKLLRKEIGADAYVMSAHKGLMGMSGLGFALIGEGFEPEPVFFGGTGIYSEAKEQPYELPYRLEAGTPNYIAINSLKNSIDYLIGNEYIRLNAECNKMFQLFVEDRITSYNVCYTKLLRKRWCISGAQ